MQLVLLSQRNSLNAHFLSVVCTSAHTHAFNMYQDGITNTQCMHTVHK